MPSSTPRKKPTDRKPKTTNYGSSWKTQLVDLDLPSGERCQVKRPGIQGLIKANVLHSLDTLTSIVQTETIPKAEGKPLASEKDVESIVNDPAKFGKMMDTVDKIVIHVVTQPKVVSNLVPVLDEDGNQTKVDGEIATRELEDSEREDGVVYVDYIDAMDKMYIMNFAVGGSADLAEFRQATETSVGSISAIETAQTTP